MIVLSAKKTEENRPVLKHVKQVLLFFGDINEIISGLKKDVVMEITKDIKGIEPSEVPENIRIFQSIKEKIAQLGPMPSSN